MSIEIDPWTGQRSVQYRYEIIDGTTGEHRGQLHPLRGSSPSLSHDTTSTITRRLQGLTLAPDEADLFRPLVDRIDLYMVADGVDWPLGRYVASDDISTVISDGVSGSVTSLRPLTLCDEMFIIDQDMPDSYAASGILISEVIKDLLSGINIKDLLIGPCSMTSSLGWSAGTSRASVLKDLCSAGGYFNPWFDHSGTLRCVPVFDPAQITPTFDFDARPRVIRDSITVTDESLTAPNRFVVVSNDTGTSGTPIVGIYDVPSTAPHSHQNRGFYITDVLDVQVESLEQAQVYARTIGIQLTIVERLDCSTPPDPRHDAFDVVRFLGENWLEIGWSIDLSGTGVMSHVLSRTYAAGEE